MLYLPLGVTGISLACGLFLSRMSVLPNIGHLGRGALPNWGGLPNWGVLISCEVGLITWGLGNDDAFA